MQILIVTGIFPPDIGGPATYVPAIGRFLESAGHRVSVITWSRIVEEGSRYPFPVIRIPSSQNRLIRSLQTVAAIVRLGRGADVVFANGLAFESTVASRIIGRPIVLKIVGDWAWERAVLRKWTISDFSHFQREKGALRIRLLKKIRNGWARAADRIIVPSHFLADCVRQWGVSKERIKVVYNSFDPLHLAPSHPGPLPASRNVLTVGRLVPWKGVDGIIRCLQQLENVGLVVVGSGPEEAALRRLVRSLGMEQQVFFVGLRSRSETLGLMKACQAFALNSSYEGFPHVILEAMSAGIPVIARAAGGVPEIVQDGHNGLLISDDESLCRALSSLLQDSTLSERLTRNASGGLRRFRRESMYEQTEAILCRDS